jgi:hypothetical protein
MRLHSDFHDYYDHAIGYGIDELVHYNRFQKSVEIQLKSSADRPVHRRSGVLGFCGTLFPFIQIARYDKKHDFDYLDDYDGRVVEEFYAFSLEEYKKKEEEWSDYSDDFGFIDDSRRIKLKQFFLDWHFSDDTVFLEYQVPIWRMQFYSEASNALLNPSLRECGFERMKDSVTTFQEISTYIANVIVEQKPLAKVDDKHRIEQHGFDLKESFRRRKEGLEP